MTDVYGDMKAPSDVTKALKETIETWIPFYIAEISAQHGYERDFLPPFLSYTFSARGLLNRMGDQLPCCVLVCPGTIGNARALGDGNYIVEWNAGVGSICSGQDQDNTNELVGLYCTAVKALIVQHQSLGGFAAETRWIRDGYNELPFDSSRTIAGGIVNLGVSVNSVVNSRRGLLTPPADPLATPGDWETVETVGVTTEGKS